jgi:hypothetical protein
MKMNQLSLNLKKGCNAAGGNVTCFFPICFVLRKFYQGSLIVTSKQGARRLKWGTMVLALDH